MNPPDPRRVAALRRVLLTWWDAHRRLLPWRRDRDPYRIWVAEVMLQQTRVDVVVPAYERFLAAFPELARLASADEERVLALWSGLGYYARARALRRAARVLVAAGERTFPRTREAALRLPGVGPYTAAAVLSMAHNEPLAAVDGNVVRVLSRLEQLGLPGASGQPHAALAARLLDCERPGDWNQAMMELGQTVCLPRSPRCSACPLARWCRARRAGAVSRHPPRRPRAATQRHALSLVMVRDRARRLLLERGAFPHLPHLWLPPTEIAALDGLPRNARRARAAGSFRHAILHRRFDVRVVDCVVPAAALDRALRASRTTVPPPARSSPPPGVERRAFARAELATICRSSLLTKALRVVGHEVPGVART